MADQQEVYRRTPTRTTNELETDTTTLDTKRVSLYGWDNSNSQKRLIRTNPDGELLMDTLESVIEQTALSISSSITSAGISSSAYTQLSVMNSGSKIIYFGGSACTTANGMKLFQNQSWVFDRCKEDFKVYFVTPVGDTSEVRVIER